MSDFRKVEDQRYITTLFTGLSKQKEVPIALHYNNHQVYARLTVTTRNRQTFTIVPGGDLPVSPEENVRISLFYKEIFFIFESEVCAVHENSFEIRIPNKVYASYRRLVNRYKPKNTEEATIGRFGTDQRFHLVDISTQGLAFIADERCFEENETVRNMVVRFADGPEICLDMIVKHVTKQSEGKYFYGMAILSIEWHTYQTLFKYIFESSYPYFRLFETFSSDQIMKLYEEARFLHLKPRDGEDELFLESIRDMDQLKDKPLIASNLVYQKNNKLIAVGSALRVYNRSFLGKPLMMMAQVRLNPKAKTDIYIGLADYLLSHPYFQYYLAYIEEDYEWHHEILTNAAEIVNDPGKLQYETAYCWEIKITNNMPPLSVYKVKRDNIDYSCELIEKPDETFFDFCRAHLFPLEVECYGLEPGQFNLEELSQIYHAYGFNMSRKLWRIHRGNQIIGYALAECYSDVLSRTGNLDSCKLFFADDSIDLENVIKELLPELEIFYTIHGKGCFSLVCRFNPGENHSIDIPGLTPKKIGRFITNREGLSEYKKLLLANFEYYSKYFPLTYPQKGIWYLEKMYPGTSIANIAGTIRIKEDIRFDLLEQAINIFVTRNESMRLRVIEDNGLPRQYEKEYQPFKPDFFDFSSRPITEFYQCETDLTSRPFFLIDSDLYYFALFKISDQEGGFYAKMHHLISDAWTMGLIGSQVVEIYDTLKNNIKVSEDKKPSYFDFVLSEDEYQYSEKFEKDRAFWNKKYDSVPEMMTLKTRRQHLVNPKTARNTYKIDGDLAKNIRDFCNDTKISPFTLFISILTIYLNRITLKDDIVIATPILNRGNAKEKETAGMFIGTVPFRLIIDTYSDFYSFVQYVTKEWMLLLKHQKYPFELILKEVREKYKISENLYDVMISYQNTKFDKECSTEYISRWHFNGYQPESLCIHIGDRDDQGVYIINLDYLEVLFGKDEIERFPIHFTHLIDDAVHNSDKKIGELELLSSEEKRKLLIDFNNTQVNYPFKKSLVDYFEEQVAKSFENIAVIFEDQTLTYRELNQKANQIARVIQAKGARPDSIVGIMVERSLEMIIGIFGIIKAGAAYLPIDPQHPKERIEYFLSDSKTDLLLTTSKHDHQFQFKGEVLYLEDPSLYQGDNSNLQRIGDERNLAYVIYTSGSTGQPKGVMIEHQSIINRLLWMQKMYPLTIDDVILQKTTFTFDVSVWEIFWWALQGSKVCLLKPLGEKDPAQIVETIVKSKVTVMHFVPSMLNLFLEYLESNVNLLDKLLSLRQVFASGEALNPQQVDKFNTLINKYVGAKLSNLYGPTEAAVDVSYFDCSEGEKLNTIPIGKPIDNIKLMIVNKNYALQPIGFPGELLIAGAGLARGYVNKPELTREKFIELPVLAYERAYRTGDLAAWDTQGNIEYLGRMDNQLKIRGFRIELGEIETCLLQFHSINQVVVKVWDHVGNKFLCAYFTANQTIDISVIKNFLVAKLPDYMIPQHFMQLGEIPLTPNGKVNRNALPFPERNLMEVNNFSGPQNDVENELYKIWSEVLEIERIGRNESFFNLGGDSLSAITLSLKMSRKFNTSISVKEIFEQQTIQNLALHIRELNSVDYQQIGSESKKDFSMVSSAEKRIFLLCQMDNARTLYNMPVVFEIHGDIDKQKLERAFQCLIRRHESLRSSFHFENGQLVRKIADELEFHIQDRTIKSDDLKDSIDEFFRPFDLSKAPLIRAEILQTDTQRFLLVDLHHIIADGISVSILIKELTSILSGMELSPPNLQYKDYAIWQNHLSNSDLVIKQKNYWMKLFEGEIPILNIPTDYPRPVIQSFDGDRHTFVLDMSLSAQIKNICSQTGTTLFMVLLACYNILLSRYTNQDDIIVASPVACRNHVDFANVVGMFVNTILLRNHPDNGLTFVDFLTKVKDNVINALNNQEYQFEELIEQLEIPRDVGRNALFNTMFILQNYNISEVDLGNSRLVPYSFVNKISKFDLTLEAWERSDGLVFDFEYCTSLFKKDTIHRMAGHLVNIFREITSNINKVLADIELLSDHEAKKILHDFNDTNIFFQKDKTINELFEEQVERTPNNIAIICNGNQISYKELNDKANSVAHYLISKNIKANEIVGLRVKRSLEMFAGLLGILKSGCAYLPIDPDYPTERMKYMLEDSSVKILLTQSFIDNTGFIGETINLDYLESSLTNSHNPTRRNTVSDLAYVIYTSGSTGVPKGVMIEHRALNNFIWGISRIIEFKEGKAILAVTSVSFDIFFVETILPFIFGMKILLLTEEERNRDILDDIIKRYQVEMIQMTPSRLGFYLQNIDSNNWFSNIKQFLIGGEPFPDSLLIKLQKLTKARIYNMYGPTETTIWSTIKDLTNESKITIGSPILNTKVYILNKQNKPQPLGIPGQLCIGGDGLSRGYIGKNELTNQKFISNPFQPGQKIYLTGDLARWLPDGNIEFLGRTDFQVKIRGNRIELGEIESRLLEHESIQNAVVISRPDKNGNNYLCAYYVLKNGSDQTDYRKLLIEKLPGYMIPSYFIKVSQIPVTVNGKLDREALPDPIVSTRSYEPPRNETEKFLSIVWSKVLEKELVGIFDNYFELGGDSLSLMWIQTILFEKGWYLSYQDFYRFQTVAELSEVIDGKQGKKHNNTLIIDKETISPFPIPEDKNWSPFLKRKDRCVLLTGASGYLGMHILKELMFNTDTDVYCLIRSLNNKSAKYRLFELMDYYGFNEYQKLIGTRLFVIDGDITLPNLGLPSEIYYQLGSKVDSIYHCAALVKHYGDLHDFENVNVSGTKEIIKFASINNMRLNYISTTSIAGQYQFDRNPEQFFTENDFYIDQNFNDNVYLYTKFMAENEVLKAMNTGLDALIFRVGNLTPRYIDGKFQINQQENIFYRLLKSIIEIGIIPEYLLEKDLEFTPIDICSNAIMQLATVKGLKHRIFHVFNHKYIKLKDYVVVLNNHGYKVDILDCTLEEYFNLILSKNEKPEVINFLLDYLERDKQMSEYPIVIISSKISNEFLNLLGFYWPTINEEYLLKTLKSMENVVVPV